MTAQPGPRDWLARLGTRADAEIDPADTVLRIAAMERPTTPLEPYHRHMEKLAREVADYAGGPDAADADLNLRLEALREVIARRHGYSGDGIADDDVDAADMMRVIDRRRGLPVMLGILYLGAARAAGWRADGLGPPGRFLVRIEGADGRSVVDPFGGGRTLSPQDLRQAVTASIGGAADLAPDQFVAMGNREIVLRAENNAKAALLKAGRPAEALVRIEAVLLLAPGEAALWREAGILNARLDRTTEAVAALEESLRLGGDEDGYRTSVLLQELQGRLE